MGCLCGPRWLRRTFQPRPGGTYSRGPWSPRRPRTTVGGASRSMDRAVRCGGASPPADGAVLAGLSRRRIGSRPSRPRVQGSRRSGRVRVARSGKRRHSARLRRPPSIRRQAAALRRRQESTRPRRTMTAAAARPAVAAATARRSTLRRRIARTQRAAIRRVRSRERPTRRAARPPAPRPPTRGPPAPPSPPVPAVRRGSTPTARPRSHRRWVGAPRQSAVRRRSSVPARRRSVGGSSATGDEARGPNGTSSSRGPSQSRGRRTTLLRR